MALELALTALCAASHRADIAQLLSIRHQGMV